MEGMVGGKKLRRVMGDRSQSLLDPYKDSTFIEKLSDFF